jgi:hypothetical protein
MNSRLLTTSSRTPLSVFLACLTLFAAACSLIRPPEQEEPTGVEQESESERESAINDLAALEAAYRQLQAEYSELEDQATKAELRVLERDARIAELGQRLEAQQRIIDESISEVVRARARLRSAESRAEAASQMAEAEIALKALGDLPGGAETREYVQAAELLGRSVQEFERENYGGAIFLTDRAKSLIRTGQLRLTRREEIEPSAGETLFQAPLSLRVVTNSNIRTGPGLQYAVLTTLEEGTPVIGYSYKGKWIRVALKDGRRGWIDQSLVEGR